MNFAKAEEAGLEPAGPFRITAFQAVAMAAMRLLLRIFYTSSLVSFLIIVQ